MKSQAEKLSDQIRFYCFQKDTAGKKSDQAGLLYESKSPVKIFGSDSVQRVTFCSFSGSRIFKMMQTDQAPRVIKPQSEGQSGESWGAA